MILSIKPSDLIKRFIWDKYQHFCLQHLSYNDINNLIKTDKEFIISEEDAFVIGLTNVIYTDNVIYKLKQHMKEVLENKSFDEKETLTNVNEDSEDDTYVSIRLMVNKQLMIDSAKEFLNKIPAAWDYSKESNKFNTQLESIPKIISVFVDKIEKLPISVIQEWPCIKYVSAKKTINKYIV
jgi:hypothetical protein